MRVSTPFLGGLCLGNLRPELPACGYPGSHPFEPGRTLGHASAMDRLPPQLAFFLLLVSGWVNRHQEAVISCLLEESRVLLAAHGPGGFASPTTSGAAWP
jgi:hypothetical protein